MTKARSIRASSTTLVCFETVEEGAVECFFSFGLGREEATLDFGFGFGKLFGSSLSAVDNTGAVGGICCIECC